MEPTRLIIGRLCVVDMSAGVVCATYTPPPPPPSPPYDPCSSNNNCQTGSTCVSHKGSTACCPSASPLWCGGNACFDLATYGTSCVEVQYGGNTVVCPSGFPMACNSQCSQYCRAGYVCVYHLDQYSCCPDGYPVWCGDTACHAHDFVCS